MNAAPIPLIVGAAGDVAFLACFLGIPVLMVLAILWLSVRAIRSRLALRTERRNWEDVDEDELRAELNDFPPLEHKRIWLSSTLAREVDGHRLHSFRYLHRRGSGQHRSSSVRIFLAVPVDIDTGTGLIAPRQGGMLEGVALAVGSLAGSPPLELSSAHAWARAHGTPSKDALDPARADALQAILRPGDELFFHGKMVVLGRPADRHVELLQEAPGMAAALRDALAAPSA